MRRILRVGRYKASTFEDGGGSGVVEVDDEQLCAWRVDENGREFYSNFSFRAGPNPERFTTIEWMMEPIQ